MIDPRYPHQSDEDGLVDAIGFTGYFRCHTCDGGGPWEIPDNSLSYILTLSMQAMDEGTTDGPVVFGAMATFDGYEFRYATEAEAHLKDLIEQDPERAYLWVRLGNIYGHGGATDLAEAAFKRATELDPSDVEARGVYGTLLCDSDRYLEAVPHWHAVLKHVRNAGHLSVEFRRNLVRAAIENLLAAHAESHGQIDLFPKFDPDPSGEGAAQGEPAVFEIREFDLGSDADLDDLCDDFLGVRRRGVELFRNRKHRSSGDSGGWHLEPFRRSRVAVARNAKCPCGSGRKYKKCCGRSPTD